MDLVERVWALSEEHAPGRVLVVVGDGVSARWVAGSLAQRGVVGVRVLDVETLLRVAMEELVGEGVGRARVLTLVREALEGDEERRFARIAEQPSYQRAVLRIFVELERGLAGMDVGTVMARLRGVEGSRDAVMLGAFERFRAAMAEERGWWAGMAPRAVLVGHRRVSFLRRRAAAVALGFSRATTALWQAQLLEGLGFERWGDELGMAGSPGAKGLALRLSCAGPEAEIAAVARALRSESERAAVVLAPADAIPRWIARLRHRDVPVRAWVERRPSSTAAARVVRALLRIVGEPGAVRRDDLERVLFGPALRAWKSTAEQLGVDYPRQPHPGDLHGAWEHQRASAFALATLVGRLSAAGDASAEALGERARRFDWPAQLLDQRRARARDAHRMLAAAVERLEQLARARTSADLRALLDDWDLLGRAAVHGAGGPELTAARVAVDLCARTEDFSALATDLDHELSVASTGSWTQSRALDGGGGPPVWVLPYESVTALGVLPERVFMTGLDAHPRAPTDHGLISDVVRAELGLVSDRDRFRLQLRLLDELLASAQGPVVASWRHRDGAGAQRPPGPWIAGRQDQGQARSIGADAIALPSASEPGSSDDRRAPLERALVEWHDDPELRRRVEAIRSHEAPAVGPHTGALGVRVEPRVPYSASALQRYARLPYQYFVERVIGLRELGPRADSAASLLASEQGQVVHRALEAAHAHQLAAVSGWLPLAGVSESLHAEVLDALSAGYRKRAEHGQAEAIWTSERDRWAVELGEWWQHWHQRLQLALGGGGGGGAGASGSRRRPEPEQLIPGPFLLAVEWSPSTDDPEAPPFELDLGLRTIPFVAAVDRIELDPMRSRLAIVDYKTSRPRWPAQLGAELRAGIHLQLPLYALAVTQVASTTPERLRLPSPVPVGALRLEYLQRPLARAGGRPSRPEARGFAPGAPLGVDASGQTWTIVAAAASFTVAFVNAIEAGRFPVVARGPVRRFGAVSRIDELARVVPSAEQRPASLPPMLGPLPDPRLAREVVQ